MQVSIIAEPQYVPKYGTSGSAGADLIIPKTISLSPGSTEMVNLGIRIHIDNPGYYGLIVPRSGLGSQGIILGNTCGIIDSDYQGPISLCLYNRTNETKEIKAGTRVAQLLILPVTQVSWNIVPSFDEETERGSGGFGSTGQ